MSKTLEEILTQPACWRRAAALAGDPQVAGVLPLPGADLAVVGCGTSWFVAQACTAAREAAGRGRSDPFTASEFPRARAYPQVLAISRSGTTSEVEALLRELPGDTASTVITGVDDSPCARAAKHRVLLDFADEESVVQTRFATSVLALLRAALGHDVAAAAADAERALSLPLPLEPGAVEQVSFLGSDWTIGLANEAALKCREAAQLWTESYPAMEYRHGPISIAQPGRAVWPFGPLPPGLADQVHATGATLVDLGDLDPMASLVVAQRFAVAAAETRGLDPDRPRNLTRSVVLAPGQVNP
jgi:fructoselysine-6-P-deglycase FrlB-like protein